MHYSRFKNKRIQAKLRSDKKFRKFTLSSLIMIFIFLLTFSMIVRWPDVRYWFKLKTSFGKELKPEWVCMDSDRLRMYKTTAYIINNHLFHACSTECYQCLSNSFESEAYKTDTISGKKVLKSNALIGLKMKNSPEIIYFEDRQTFTRYYALNNLP